MLRVKNAVKNNNVEYRIEWNLQYILNACLHE